MLVEGIVQYVRLKIHRFAAPEVTMLKTPEVAQKGHQIRISPYANRDFPIFSAYGHALFGACAKILSQLLKVVETFPTQQNNRNGHIYI